jgi:hypothetical protein
MSSPRSFRWQIVPFTVSAFIGAVTLPGPCVGLVYMWMDILFLHDKDWYLESAATKWMLMCITMLPIGSAFLLLAARAWWRNQNLRGLLLIVAAAAIWLVSATIYNATQFR